MYIDSHMHLINTKCFDRPTYDRLGQSIPKDTDINQLVEWMKAAGIEHCVCMGQDMHKVWNSEFGEVAVEDAFAKYPDFFVPFCSVEPIDEAGRFNQKNYDYMVDKLNNKGYRGVLFTPPYGQFNSNDPVMFPFYEAIDKAGAVCQYHHSAAGGPTVLAHTKYAKMENLNDVTFHFPHMKKVVEHIGYPFSEYLFTMMVNDENLWTDLAMLYKRPLWMTWNMVLAKETGVLDRVMFATDFVAANNDLFGPDPTKDILEWVDLVQNGMNKICKQSGWPTFTEKEIMGILHDNAARLYNLCENALSEADVYGIGMGIPGPVDKDGNVEVCVNLFWNNFNPAEEMRKFFPHAYIQTGNDANVAALGEFVQGAGRKYKTMMLITLGTGVGGGIILNGDIVLGASGLAGEIGHIAVGSKDSGNCNCGNCGCVDQFASATGIVRRMKKILAENEGVSQLRKMRDFTAKDVCEQAKKGDPLAVKCVEFCMGVLGRAMAIFAHAFDPEVFVIGGGVSGAGALITNAIYKEYKKNFFLTDKKNNIILAELGNDAGIIGAAALVSEEGKFGYII